MTNAPGERSVSIKMNDEFIARLDNLANLAKLSRVQMIRNILDIGVEELERLRSVGILQLSIMLRDLHESVMGNRNLEISDPVSGEKPIPIKMETELIFRLDTLAHRGGLTRHQLIKNILRVGVEEAESMAKFGILQFAVIVSNLPGSFRKFLKKGEDAFTTAEKTNGTAL